MNLVVMRGNLVANPELVTLPSGAVTTKFTVAVNRDFVRADGTRDSKVAYVPCQAWDSGAKVIAKYYKKGDPILLEGALETVKWVSDGETRTRLCVRVNQFHMMGRRKKKDEKADNNDNDFGNEQNDDHAEMSNEISF
jgi:single-strand DNA-binding protein